MSNPQLPQTVCHTGNDTAFWVSNDVDGSCPVCSRVVKTDLLSDSVLGCARLVLSGSRQRPLAYLRCVDCGTVYAPDAEALAYEMQDGSAEALRYYLEAGAGIDLMIEPLRRLNYPGARRYAEIGCSFGFSLDYARLYFGWDVRGIDPSPLASAGRDALELPIELRYMTKDTPLPSPRVDVLQAAEVIEHVTDPHGFMHALVSSLKDDGILIISTPNAATLRPGTSESVLLQILQPGMHLCLLTAESIVALATAHGLMYHHVDTTSDDITLYAARHPFLLRPPGSTDRGDYIDYLRRRGRSAPASTSLRRGLQSRLVRELTILGGSAEIDALLPEIFADYLTFGVDLAKPETLVHTSSVPFSVGAMLHSLGMHEINGHGNKMRGVAYLDACAAWQATNSSPLAIAGVEDASAASLGRLARRQATSVLIGSDPVKAHDRLIANAEGAGLALSDLRSLFSGLVNHGDHARAAIHYIRVVLTIDEPDDRSLVHARDAVGLTAITCFTLGIFALNHAGDRSTARNWFRRAADLTALDSAHDDIRSHAMLGLYRATDPSETPATAGAELIQGVFERSATRDKNTPTRLARRLLSRIGLMR